MFFAAVDLLNNPVALTALIVGIVLLVLFVVLYVTILKRKIAKKRADAEAKRLAELKYLEEHSGLSGEVFKERSTDVSKKENTDKEVLDAIKTASNTHITSSMEGIKTGKEKKDIIDTLKTEENVISALDAARNIGLGSAGITARNKNESNGRNDAVATDVSNLLGNEILYKSPSDIESRNRQMTEEEKRAFDASTQQFSGLVANQQLGSSGIEGRSKAMTYEDQKETFKVIDKFISGRKNEYIYGDKKNQPDTPDGESPNGNGGSNE